MTQQLDHVYEFGPFRVDPGERILSREGKPVPVSAKAFDTLLFMLQRSGHLIEKEELIRAIWPDSFVEEGNLKVVIWALRKAFEVDVGERNTSRPSPNTVIASLAKFVASPEQNPK